MNSEQLLRKPWHIAHPNVLIEGADIAIDEAIDDLWRWLSEPVYVCSLPGPLELPSVTTGALVLRDVSTLAPVQQDEILRWIDEPNRRVQVVSASSTRLFSLVENGTFDEGLYYRLNVVVERVEEPLASIAVL